MCLALADKLDFAKNRYKKDITTYPAIAPYLNILKTNIKIVDDEIILEVCVNKEFSIDSLKDDYFNIKLLNVLNLLSEAKDKKCSLMYNIINNHL